MKHHPFLFIPGLLCDARLFGPQVEALGPGATVVQAAGQANTAPHFQAMAEHLLAHAPPRFALAGLSMGGILAFEVWRQAPERVTHLALLDTTPHPDTPQKRAMRLEHIEMARAGRLRELVEQLAKRYPAEAHQHDDTLHQTVVDMGLSVGPEALERQALALRDRVDSVPTLSAITCPTLVLCGAEDRLCPVAIHEEMARGIPQAELVVVERAGHLSTLEQPSAVTDALRRLWAR